MTKQKNKRCSIILSIAPSIPAIQRSSNSAYIGIILSFQALDIRFQLYIAEISPGIFYWPWGSLPCLPASWCSWCRAPTPRSRAARPSSSSTRSRSHQTSWTILTPTFLSQVYFRVALNEIITHLLLRMRVWRASAGDAGRRLQGRLSVGWWRVEDT